MEKMAIKNTKHRVFNLKLYTDMLRQLKLVGFVLGAITLIITLLPPLVTFLNRLSSDTDAVQTLSVNGVVPILWGYMFFGGAGLVYAAFSFLNKRNASDYYHALPNTALAAWLSITAAVVTWLLGTIVANILLAYLANLIAGISVSLFYIPYLLGYFGIGTLLVAAAASIAVCITGTRLTNLVLTGLILFVPRFITALLSESIVSYAQIIPFSQTGIVFNPLYNIAAIPISLFISLEGSSRIVPIGFLPGMLYSGVLALIYFGLALVFYRARRSETAGMSAPSRLMQHIYRCVITLPILIILPAVAFSSRRNIFSYVFENISLSVVILALAVIVYFTYELITTKKFRNVLTTLPLFVVLVVAVPFVTYYMTSASAHAMLHNIPAESNVNSINELASQYDYDTSYRKLLLEDIDHDNPELISAVIKALDNTVKKIDSGYNNLGDYRATFKINYGISSITRTVYFTEDEFIHVNELIRSSEAYINASKRSLPLDREITLVALENSERGSDAAKIWVIYKDEISALSPDEIDEALSGESYPGSGMYISVGGNRGFDIFQDRYFIGDLTPKTAEAFFDCYAEESGEEYRRLIADIRNNAKKYDYISFMINIYTPGSDGYLSYYSNSNGEDAKIGEDGMWDAYDSLSAIKLFSSLTSENDMRNTTLSSPFAYVTYSYSEYSESYGYKWDSGAVYLPITPEQIDAFTSGLEK